QADARLSNSFRATLKITTIIIANACLLGNCLPADTARALCSAALHGTARAAPTLAPFVTISSESNRMTDTPTTPPGPAPQLQATPLTLHGQYIKDLSFENPRAPQSLIEQKQPQLTLNVNVSTRQFEAKTFEVTLSIEASAHTPEKEPLFMLEL